MAAAAAVQDVVSLTSEEKRRITNRRAQLARNERKRAATAALNPRPARRRKDGAGPLLEGGAGR